MILNCIWQGDDKYTKRKTRKVNLPCPTPQKKKEWKFKLSSDWVSQSDGSFSMHWYYSFLKDTGLIQTCFTTQCPKSDNRDCPAASMKYSFYPATFQLMFICMIQDVDIKCWTNALTVEWKSKNVCLIHCNRVCFIWSDPITFCPHLLCQSYVVLLSCNM